MRKVIFMRIAIFGGFRDRGATRVGETKDFGDFVKTFADGVVSGGADDFELVVGGHTNNLGVAAGDDKGEKWKLEVFV